MCGVRALVGGVLCFLVPAAYVSVLASFFQRIPQIKVELLSLLHRMTRGTNQHTAHSHTQLALASMAHHPPMHPIRACRITSNP